MPDGHQREPGRIHQKGGATPKPVAIPRALRGAIAAIAAIIALGVGAAPALSGSGGVYIDGNTNVAAGLFAFQGTAPSGSRNVGLGYAVMNSTPNGPTGSDNTGSGDRALYNVT
jgi:hypothetical protein